MIRNLAEQDIIKYVTDTILRNGYGEVNLLEYLKIADEEFIEDVLDSNYFEFVKKSKGIYEIKEQEIPEDKRQEVIDYINQCIQERGFDEFNRLEIDTWKRFDLNQVSIIKIIWHMGYPCEIRLPIKMLIVNDQVSST